MRCIGKGTEAARIFCGIMNLPPPPTKFSKYNKMLLGATKDVCDATIKDAVEETVKENQNIKYISPCHDEFRGPRSDTVEISYIVKKYLETGSVENKPRPGGPSKLTSRAKRLIVRSATNKPMTSAQNIANELLSVM
ncbi:hypothetical protein TNCV_429331 [Trichonephila clavipes]|nr:hypothetical protein TNCV_429331 [Trichonephila clavipes]